jgi:hypothetical protein
MWCSSVKYFPAMLITVLLTGCQTLVTPVYFNNDGSISVHEDYMTDYESAEKNAHAVCAKRLKTPYAYHLSTDRGAIALVLWTRHYACLSLDEFQRRACNMSGEFAISSGEDWDKIKGTRRCAANSAWSLAKARWAKIARQYELEKEQAQKPTENRKASIDDSTQACRSLGFTPGTEKFGNCVLTLMEGN